MQSPLGNFMFNNGNDHKDKNTACWIMQKYLCVKIICRIARVLDWPQRLTASASQVFSNKKQKLSQCLVSLATKLLLCSSSEDKAAGLNILSSFCGLDKQNQEEVFVGQINELDFSLKTQQILQNSNF